MPVPPALHDGGEIDLPAAVPEGASTFWRWCISTISASYCAGGRAAAIRSAKASTSVTPAEKFAA
jgi:hypothetical protein